MLYAIAAADTENGLGFQGQLQFHIREDLRRFAALTRGHAVIYGRKTLETFPGGKPLKDRENIILSRTPGYEVEGATIRNDYPVGCSNETPQGRNGAEAVFTIGKGTGLLVMTEKLINRHH